MLYYLNGLFVGLLILSNILAVKLFSIGELDCTYLQPSSFMFSHIRFSMSLRKYTEKKLLVELC